MSQNRLNADEVTTFRHVRAFIQFGGARPGNGVSYAGQDAQYMTIEGVGVPELGGVDPYWVHDPRVIGQYKLVGRSYNPPDLASATINLRERHGAIPRQLMRSNCQFNMYEVHGTCKDLSDFLTGWTDYVLIYSGGIVTEKDLGGRISFDSDDIIQDSLSIVLAAVYPIGALGFGTNAATLFEREVVDIVYGSKVQCGDCGPEDDGTMKIYAITGAYTSSPGLAAEVIYTVDGGQNWYEDAIDGIGVSADPVAIDIVGDKLMIITKETNGAIYWCTINSMTGAPSASGWTKVTSGFVASSAPNDIYVLTPHEVFLAADGGYIYKSTDITASVTASSAAGATSENLNRIHGQSETIVAVGANGVVVKTTNRGRTWATTTTEPGSNPSITAVWVLSQTRYWVGTASTGAVYYTLNGGETWTSKAFTGSGAGDVNDIVFATDEVGYIAYKLTAGPVASLLCTWNGGADWTASTPRILNWPVFDKPSRLAFPDVHESIAANNLAIAGLSGDGTDGILLVGVAAKV